MNTTTIIESLRRRERHLLDTEGMAPSILEEAAARLEEMRATLRAMAPIHEALLALAIPERIGTILTQDAECTAHPIWEVHRTHRVYGFDAQYSDNPVWVDSEEGREADAEECERLEARYEATGDDSTTNGWTRTAYQDREEVVTACFTRQGAQAYIDRNGHNLLGPGGKPAHIFVNSLYRNEEMIAVRNLLWAIARADQQEVHHGA